MKRSSELLDRSARAERLYAEHEMLEKLGDRTASRKKLQEAAELGAVYALYSLAYEYYNDDPPRLKDALNLYRRAVLKGDCLSAWNLAHHYEMTRSARLYFHWLRKAAEMGMAEASDELNEPFPYLVRKAEDSLKQGRSQEALRDLVYAAERGNTYADSLLAKLNELR
jgi:TPR repeat protein